ncbi:MAG TPA: MFS transporter [Solirubrobacteraceae bacterium]|nr:MFS transporter [Solirubrobacteraceae bacterium]
MTESSDHASFLSTRRGKLTLAFVCAVGFLDFVDASIVNVALPTIRHHLHFSVQSLQWVLSGYLLTYGGFMLLGGRAGDLIGRRRMLVSGTAVFALSSLAGGLSGSEGLLIAARLAQGTGAAMMVPAALSILTTSFVEGSDRHTALGVWGALAGLASALGVFLGGVLSQEAGWRWVFFVNLPVCVLILVAAFRLVPREQQRARLANFDALGAFLATAGMLLLVYALVNAPDVGWGTTRTVAELGGAALLLAGFAVNELRHRNPLFPLSIFRINGLGAADAVMVIAMAGFYSLFFFITLYMQNVLHYSQIEAGAAYLPTTFGVAISAGVSSQLLTRIGTRPIIALGALVAAGAVFWLSRIPVHGSYTTDLLPGLLIMSLGLGAVFVGVQTAAQAGVPQDKAGLAAALVNASTWLGGALGLAIFSAISTSRIHDLLAIHAAQPVALTAGFHRALLAAALFLVAAAAIASRATNTRGQPATTADFNDPAPIPDAA